MTRKPTNCVAASKKPTPSPSISAKVRSEELAKLAILDGEPQQLMELMHYAALDHRNGHVEPSRFCPMLVASLSGRSEPAFRLLSLFVPLCIHGECERVADVFDIASRAIALRAFVELSERSEELDVGSSDDGSGGYIVEVAIASRLLLDAGLWHPCRAICLSAAASLWSRARSLQASWPAWKLRRLVLALASSGGSQARGALMDEDIANLARQWDARGE